MSNNSLPTCKPGDAHEFYTSKILLLSGCLVIKCARKGARHRFEVPVLQAAQHPVRMEDSSRLLRRATPEQT